MRPRPSLFLLCGVLALAASARAGESPQPAPRPRLTQEMRARVAAAAHASSPTESTPSSSLETPATVTLQPFWVEAYPLGAGPRREGQPPYLKAFTLTTGGSLARNTGRQVTTEMKIQWDGLKSWTLLNLAF